MTGHGTVRDLMRERDRQAKVEPDQEHNVPDPYWNLASPAAASLDMVPHYSMREGMDPGCVRCND